MSDNDWHWWQGPRVYACKVNDVTDRQIRLAYALYGKTVPLTQGSMFGAGGGASASAGTHNGTSVVDFSVIGMSIGEIKKFVTVLRKAGFAAWYRPYIRNLWPSHIHCVLIQPGGIAQGAVNQIYWFKQGRTGLVGEAKDRIHEWVGWTTYKNALKKYAKEAASLDAPATPITKGLFDMSTTTRLQCARKFDLPPTVEKTLPINDNGDVTIISGPTKDFNVNVQLRIENLPAGSSVQVYVYSVDYQKGQASKQVWASDQVEIVGTGGNTYGQAIFDGSLGTADKGWSRRLRVRAVTTAGSEAAPVTITRSTITARKV